MIKYALACAAGHDFEGWFGSSQDFDDQAQRGLVECPVCGARDVAKQIMAPAVAGTKVRGVNGPGIADAMAALRAHVEDNFDDVGEDFAAEARAIHKGESEQRGIFGQATGEEVMSLVEEGVPVAPMPPKRRAKREIN